MKTAKDISPSRLAFNKLKKNRIAQLSASVIGMVILIALLGPIIRPDHAPDANSQLLSISRKKPGFKANLLMDKKNEAYVVPNIFSRIAEGGWSNCSNYVPLESWEVSGDKIMFKAIGEEPEEKHL